MALMDLKSNLSWYGKTPPGVDNLGNNDAPGFTPKRQELDPTEFKGVQGEQYTHTGVRQLGTLKFTDWFLNDNAKGFTANMFPIGGEKKDSQFVGISGEEFTYNGHLVLGDLSKNIHTERFAPSSRLSVESRFVFNDDFTVSVSKAKGFSRYGEQENLTIPDTLDGFPVDDMTFSNRGQAKRKAQLGIGSPWIGHKPGWYNESGEKYGDKVKGNDYKDDAPQLTAGLAHKYTANSPIDDMYNKYNLRDDAHQIGYIKHPLILRGIQRKGKSNNQRWGLADSIAGQISSTLDLPRGGVLTSVERGVVDIARLAKFMVSPPGLAYMVRQLGQQLMNPNVEGMDGKTQKPFHKNSTKLFTPVNTLLQPLAGIAGMHIRRHGLLPVDLPGGTPGTYEGVHSARNTEGIDAQVSKNRLVLLGKEYGAGYQTSATAQLSPIGIGESETYFKGGILSGPTGPKSFGGIGSTTIRRWEDTTLKTQLGAEGAKAGAGELEFGTYTAGYYTYGRPYVGIKDSPESKILRGNALDAEGTDGGESSYGLNNMNLAYRVGTPDFEDSDHGTFHSFNIPGDNVIGQGNADHPTTMRKKATPAQESVMGGGEQDKLGDNISRLAAYTSIRKITKDRTPESSAIIDFRTINLQDPNTAPKSYGDDSTLNPNGDKTLTVRGYPNFLPTDGERQEQPDMYYGSDEPGLIPFYFNPVDPAAGSGGTGNIGFRAYIDSLDDAFTPEWGTNKDQGRADNIIQYTGFARTISVSFKVPVTSAGERREVWSRLNRLARITLPKYGGTAGFYGQFVRVTIGNLYVSVPMYINDLTYSWDAETSWEITPGEQVPFITSVDMSLGWVGNSAPSSTQRAYNYG
jgi:hypothetical protein